LVDGLRRLATDADLAVLDRADLGRRRVELDGLPRVATDADLALLDLTDLRPADLERAFEAAAFLRLPPAALGVCLNGDLERTRGFLSVDREARPVGFLVFATLTGLRFGVVVLGGASGPAAGFAEVSPGSQDVTQFHSPVAAEDWSVAASLLFCATPRVSDLDELLHLRGVLRDGAMNLDVRRQRLFANASKKSAHSGHHKHHYQQMPVLNLLTGQKSTFSPRRRDSLHRFM